VSKEYENCQFINCNFSEANLYEVVFTECIFKDCDLSLAMLDYTAFREVKFVGCKMLGLLFDKCNPFGLTFIFENCHLNHSSFYKLKIHQTHFKDCQLQEVDFSETELKGSKFENCNLLNAIFDRTNLMSSDFRTSYNFSIDPEKNLLKKAKFSMSGIGGLLLKYEIEIE
jgi:uncharacterized protein YjbI with pentapeptide repeats